MDSDADVPLSNYAGMDYLRKELAKLEKLVAEKNGPSAAVSVVSGSGRASIGSSNLNGGSGLLTGCRNLIVDGSATRRANF